LAIEQKQALQILCQQLYKRAENQRTNLSDNHQFIFLKLGGNGWCKFSTGLRRAFLSGLQRAKSLTFPFLFYNRQIKDLAVLD